MFGILNINKPAGWTSRDVVNRVTRFVRPAKAGHAGTLDPLATGVLVVCLGPATRLIQYVQQLPKTYGATFRLGETSTTEDIEGELTPLVDPPQPTLAEIESVLPEFLGTILQRPPAYSALKIDGRRAYALARRGAELELPPRPVEIYQLQVHRYAYPELELQIACGSGTYVRSLGRDLAERLGTGAVMSALERTAVGPFLVDEACELDALDSATLADKLYPPLTAAEHLEQVALTAEQIVELRHGRTIYLPGTTGSLLAAVDPERNLVALLQPREPEYWRPTYNFPSPE